MRRILSFTFIVVVLLCSACAGKNERTKNLEAELRLFQEKAITFPDNMVAMNFDEQMQPDMALLSRPLKMVVYVNQEGCQDCRLRSLLPVYMFMLENQKLAHFGVVIILHPAQIEAAESTLSEMNLRRTVFFDPDGSFERLNPHLPQNEQFHTFLLNEDNKVVLVGSPIHNEKLKNLYLAEMKR